MVTFLFIATMQPDGLSITGPDSIELSQDTPAEVRIALTHRQQPRADVPVTLRSQAPACLIPLTDASDPSAYFADFTAQTGAGTMSFVPELLRVTTDARGQVCAVLVATGDADGPLVLSAHIDGVDLDIPVRLRDS
ncbi:MAG: hypothetical protein ACI8S6_003315 [Myxococcota bacterium]|jgi:hypothetical protein